MIIESRNTEFGFDFIEKIILEQEPELRFKYYNKILVGEYAIISKSKLIGVKVVISNSAITIIKEIPGPILALIFSSLLILFIDNQLNNFELKICNLIEDSIKNHAQQRI
jgi:hypothetical protein